MTCIVGLLDAVTGSVILTAGEVKEVEDHIDQLEAENAKLREEAESWRRLTWGLELPEYPFNRLRWEELERENAKLRKLAVGMYGMLEMFDTLLGNHDACETPRPLVFGEDKSFKDAMRELGVEVPGGEV